MVLLLGAGEVNAAAAAEGRAANASPTKPAAPTLTVLFTGDNNGEVNHCGCRVNPSGGLSRRKTIIDEARRAGPVLVLDAGNALTRAVGDTQGNSKLRAELLIQLMAELGTQGMAAGARDLTFGVDFLKTQAEKAKLPVLSANLVGADGKRIFPASRTLTVGGLRVALIGLSPPGVVPASPKARGELPVAAALNEAKKLRPKSDLVIVLAAVPFADSLQLVNEGKALIDFVLQSNDARGMGLAQEGPHGWVVPTGERGRQLAQLALRVPPRATGRFLDQDERSRNEQVLEMIRGQLAATQAKLQAAPEAERAPLKALLKSFQEREATVARTLDAGSKGAKKTFQLSFRTLGLDVKEDAAVQAKIQKVEAAPGTH
jgi:2',3'-cyclic-nucleotide 2'-phosphodiesterase (5'-nucleotidase family)